MLRRRRWLVLWFAHISKGIHKEDTKEEKWIMNRKARNQIEV